MKQVFEDYAAAKAAESGRNRVYRVRQGDRELYVLAISPTAAIGAAGQELGVTAELTDPRYPTARDRAGLDAFLGRLKPADRRELHGLLLELLKGDGGKRP